MSSSVIFSIFEDTNVFTTNRNDLISAVTNLRKWGCCPRCVLRFVGVRDADVYRMRDIPALTKIIEELCASPEITTDGEKSESSEHVTDDLVAANGVASSSSAEGKHVLSEKSASQIATNGSKQQICVSCLGMLQDAYCCREFISQIAEAVEKQNFEFSTFLCSISVPVCILLREHAIWLCLSELLPGAYSTPQCDFIATIKDVWKWINGPLLVGALNAPFDQKSPFEVVLSFQYVRNDNECGFLFRLFPNVFQRRKKNRHGWDVFNRANVARAIADTCRDVFRRNFGCPPRCPVELATLGPISCQHGALYIAGRYNKLSRHLSQTPWLIEGIRKSESSVEELICLPLNAVVMATEWRFCASGREDVDVRMLGSGRPFVVELINPRRVVFTSQQLHDIQETINNATTDVAVRHLQVVTKEETSVLKEGEEEKRKRYVALCCSHDAVTDEQLSALDSVKDLALAQRTPIRVLHRRPLATRERTVYTISAKRVGDADSLYFSVELTTQAGTYVKEFVHGDLGRTTPSLGELLKTDCDILALDVVGVELDWPTPTEY